MLRFPEWVVEAFLRMLYVAHESFSDNLAALGDCGKGGRLCPGNEALEQDCLPDIHDRQNDGAVLVGVCPLRMISRSAVV